MEDLRIAANRIFRMTEGKLTEAGVLRLLAALILQYQYSSNLPLRVLKDDVTAVWDFCSELMRAKVAKN